jgi:hypothetical protein
MPSLNCQQTRAIWFATAWYNTPTDQPFVIDCTAFARRIIENRVWERKFDYGRRIHENWLAPQSIVSCKITVSPQSGFHYISRDEAVAFVEKNCGVSVSGELVDAAKLQASRNLIAIETICDSSLAIPTSDVHLSEDFVIGFQHLHAFAVEIGAFFRASLHLTYASSCIVGWTKRSGAGGLTFILSGGSQCAEPNETDSFTCPCGILNDGQLAATMSELAEVWHLSLWPIHRYLRALPSQELEMENLLDLIFTLEGLFAEKTSSDMIRVTSAILVGNSKKRAIEINEILKAAFHVRNEVAHGGKYYDGLEPIELGGETVHAQDLFWMVRDIVAPMIRHALIKLRSTAGMKTLRFMPLDLIERFYR